MQNFVYTLIVGLEPHDSVGLFCGLFGAPLLRVYRSCKPMLIPSNSVCKFARKDMAHCSAACCLGNCQRLFALVVILLLPGMAAGQGEARNSREVEAAFLRNFAHYVNWPQHAFTDEQLPWCVAILGEDPFGQILEMTFNGRSEKGRSFVLFRAASLDELPNCQIVFINYENAGKRRAALEKLKNKPVLTVGDAPEFLNEGGVIQFQVGERVSMSVNRDQARAALLTIQTKMLEVSSDILENGELRRVR